MNSLRSLLAVTVLLFLNACAGTAPAPVVDHSSAAVPVVKRDVPAVTTNAPENAGTGEGVVVSALAEPRAAAATGLDSQPGVAVSATAGAPAQGRRRYANPAVAGLLNRANLDQKNGDYTRAAASIERAIKIEPDNAWLWHRLAQARLRQGRAGQAAALAAKSNTLVVSNATIRNRELRADNWLLIARVHRQRGEFIAAKAATDRARRIQSGAG